MDFITRYNKLNSAQKQAVDSIEGPVMVVAGPGTGKTELLSMRAANILRSTDTLAQNILCLTFTESGAAAMRQRMVDIIGKDAHKIAVHTFHSFGAEIINQNNEFFYNGASFQAASDLDSFEILQGIFDSLPYDSPLKSKMNGEYTHLKDTLTVISELKKNGLLYDELISILDGNKAALEQCEPLIRNALGVRIGKATIPALNGIEQQLRDTIKPVGIPNIAPIASILTHDLSHALIEADEIGKTTPITAWKNKWFTKDANGQLIFKASKADQKLRDVAKVYEAYLLTMQERSLYDFDDMILRVVHALDTFPELRYNLSEKYQYIMVDEFQDTNLAQMRIIHTLTHNELVDESANIMVVGDDDQGIYSFQGAEISNIVNFHKTFPDVKTITLVDNYRSTQPILEAARSVITQNSDRLETLLDGVNKQLTAHKPLTHTSSTELYSLPTRAEERQYIVSQINHRITNGQKPGTIAVLARQHRELIELLPYFHAAGIPISYDRRDNVLELDPITSLRDLAQIICILADGKHKDADALLPKLLSHTAFDISAKSLWKMSLDAYANRKSWMETMAVNSDFLPLHNWLISLAQAAHHTPLEQMIDHLIGRTSPTEEFSSPYMDYYFNPDTLHEDPESYVRYLEGVRTIRDKLREYKPSTTLHVADFLQFIELHEQANTSITSFRPAADTDDAVHLMTAHKSKGLEFNTVYIVNATESTWGEKVRAKSRTISYPENLPYAPSGNQPEERLRLFFVAMTRAKEQLIMSYSETDDAGKATLLAGFLTQTDIPVTIPSLESSPQSQVELLETQWYQPLINLPRPTMQEVLSSTLQNYKLSVTHLNNFLDVSRGGPQTFLINNLLRFPQAMGANAAYGSAIHESLQRAHNHFIATGAHLSDDEMDVIFVDQLTSHHLSPEDTDRFTDQGKKTLRAYLSEARADFTRTQKVELNFAGQQVFVGSAHLTGALDLVDIDKNAQTISITDYKTGKPSRSWTGKTDYEKIKLHKYKQQLMFYQLMVRHSRDYAEYTVNEGKLQFVEQDEYGQIHHLDEHFSEEDLTKFQQLVETVWHKITSLDLPDISLYSPDYKGMLSFEEDLLKDNNHSNIDKNQ